MTGKQLPLILYREYDTMIKIYNNRYQQINRRDIT